MKRMIIVFIGFGVLFLQAGEPAQKKRAPRYNINVSALRGDVDAVRYWVEQEKVNPNAKDRAGWSVLHRAVRDNQLEVVKYLLSLKDKVEVDITDKEGKTPLHWAAIRGNSEIAKELIEAGACVDAQDPKKKRTPILWVIRMYEKAVIPFGAFPGKRLTAQEIIDFITVMVENKASTCAEDEQKKSAFYWVQRMPFSPDEKDKLFHLLAQGKCITDPVCPHHQKKKISV